MKQFKETKEIDEYLKGMDDGDEMAAKLTADGYDVNDLLEDTEGYSLSNYIKVGILFGAAGREENETNAMMATEIAREMRAQDTWNPELCEQLCELAGIKDEWDSADGMEFEPVIFKAADILGVEVL